MASSKFPEVGEHRQSLENNDLVTQVVLLSNYQKFLLGFHHVLSYPGHSPAEFQRCALILPWSTGINKNGLTLLRYRGSVPELPL